MKTLTSLFLLCLLVSPAYAQLAVPNEAGLTYGHVHLNVTDIELHKRLWVEHFDGVVVQKGPLTAVKFPNMLVALSPREPTMGSQQTVMDHFGFKVRNIDKFLDGKSRSIRSRSFGKSGFGISIGYMFFSNSTQACFGIKFEN